MLPKDGSISYEELKKLQRQLDLAIHGNGTAIHVFEVMLKRKPVSAARLKGALNIVEALLRYSSHVRGEQ